MPGFLRKATASQSRAIGPFVDDTDFKTLKTGLTIANTDIKLIVNGGASANKNSGGGTHRANGVYGVTFDATDSATVGEMEVSVLVAGALVVFDKFFVVEAAVFDALYAASAPGYLQPATAGRTLVVDAAGLADANMVKAGPTGSGTAQTAKDLGASATQTGDNYARLGAPAGASLAADVAAVKSDTAGVKTQTDKMAFTVTNQIDANVLDWKSATAPAMTGDAYARLGAPAGASVSADIAAAKTDTAAIKTKTDQLAFGVANKVDANVTALFGKTTINDTDRAPNVT